jgi:hypothetical protein
VQQRTVLLHRGARARYATADPAGVRVVDDAGVDDDGAGEHAVQLLGVDAVCAFGLAVEVRGCRLDVGAGDALVEHVPAEGGLELRAPRG